MIKFKSTPLYYVRERDGRKCNTVRKPDWSDERFKQLADGTARVIVIENSISGESFSRLISDITFWEGLYIISWKHEPSQSKENSQEEKE